mgnify:CR=1
MNHKIKHKNQALIDYAFEYASIAHHGTYRKFPKDTKRPYIVHPVGVARLVASVTDDESIIAAALLHDVVEDCDGYTIDRIKNDFNENIALLVYRVSKASVLEDGNRAVRKAIDAEHYAGGDERSQTIKVADMCNNLSDLEHADSGFIKLYSKEQEDLLEKLVLADENLRNIASVLLNRVKDRV